MQIDSQQLTPQECYKLLIGCIVPRPIAWVSTQGELDHPNVAPYSFFMGVAPDPPTLAFSAGPRGDQVKDTVRNIKHSGDFVVNVVSDPLAAAMVQTAGEYGPEVDEFEIAGLTPVSSLKITSPRVAEAAISMECRMTQIIPVGNGPNLLILGEVVMFHVRDDLIEAGKIDMHKLQPVGRLAGEMYSHTHDIFEIQRPKV